jgi:transcriptional regulator with XRE-family HTH domain
MDVLILTCTNCRRTSAADYGIEIESIPRKETWLLWGCVRCNTNHHWLIPNNRSVEDTAARSLGNSVACHKAHRRKNIYDRLKDLAEEEQRKVLFGELIWWWRNEAELEQTQAAAAAKITSRQLMRIEAGETLPHADNIERVVHAVRGSMDQAFRIIGSNRQWKEEFIRRVQSFASRQAEEERFQIARPGVRITSPDVELALEAFRNVLPVEADEDKFLIFAHIIFQSYWTRLLGGTITVDDRRAEIIPVVRRLADTFERCEDKKAKYFVVYEMARVAETFLRKQEIADFVQYFLEAIFISGVGAEQTEARVGSQWKELTSSEKLTLMLFDLINPKYQPRLIKLYQKLAATERQSDWSFWSEG